MNRSVSKRSSWKNLTRVIPQTQTRARANITFHIKRTRFVDKNGVSILSQKRINCLERKGHWQVSVARNSACESEQDRLVPVISTATLNSIQSDIRITQLTAECGRRANI